MLLLCWLMSRGINVCCQRAVTERVTWLPASLQTSWNCRCLLFQMHLKLCVISAHLHFNGCLLWTLNLTCWVVFFQIWNECLRGIFSFFSFLRSLAIVRRMQCPQQVPVWKWVQSATQWPIVDMALQIWKVTLARLRLANFLFLSCCS